jgi:hypothetical protein
MSAGILVSCLLIYYYWYINQLHFLSTALCFFSLVTSMYGSLARRHSQTCKINLIEIPSHMSPFAILSITLIVAILRLK